MSKGFNFYSKQPYNFVKDDKIQDKKRMNQSNKKLKKISEKTIEQ